MKRLSVQILECFKFLVQKARYKVSYGGRGGGKSQQYAKVLLLKGAETRLRVGCFREIQTSIKDSVHRLLKEQIEALGLQDKYRVTDHAITGINGTEFIFAGLFRNVNQIKSLEGLDIAWVEEAEKVSEDSWNILIPTIRKPDSEIWISFNPQYEDDATYKRFVANPPEGAIVREVNYYDNPYFPDVLRKEMESDKVRDFTKYEQIWLGKPRGSGRRVWSAFTKETHVREIPMEEIAKKANCYMAMDPHSHYYPFCAWVAILPKNKRGRWPEDFHKHVYAEWPTVDALGDFYHEMRTKLFYKGSLADMAREIHAHDGTEYGITVRSRFIDTRYAKGAGSWNASTQTEGVVNLFAKPENGGLLFLMPNEKAMGAQKQIIHSDMLWNTHQARSEFNEPSFSVSPRCKNVIASLLNHRLEEDSEKEEEKYKDPSDTLRIGYAGFADYGYEDPNPAAVVEYHESVNPWAI